MPTFECPRCSYHSAHFSVYLKHLQRKTPCKVEEGKTDIDTRSYGEQLREERMSKKVHLCPHCEKRYTTLGSMKVHIKKKHAVAVAVAVAPVEGMGENNVPSTSENTWSVALAETPKESQGVPEPDVIYDALLGESLNPKLVALLVKATTMEDKLQDVVKMMYPRALEGGSLSPKSLGVIKKRAIAVLQHPLTLDDEVLEDLVRTIGHDTYEQLKAFTDKLDMGDDAEFEAKTDALVLSAATG